MHRNSVLVFALTSVITLAPAALAPTAKAFAQETPTDASKPWWNPFAKTSKAEDVKKSSFFSGGGAASSNPIKLPEWKWPSMGLSADSSATKSKAVDRKSNAGSKMGTGFGKFGTATKKFWSDTVNVMNPFDGSKQEKDRWGGGYRPQGSEKKEGGFFSWMKPRREERAIRDVNGFLGQDRPRF